MYMFKRRGRVDVRAVQAGGKRVQGTELEKGNFPRGI